MSDLKENKNIKEINCEEMESKINEQANEIKELLFKLRNMHKAKESWKKKALSYKRMYQEANKDSLHKDNISKQDNLTRINY